MSDTSWPPKAVADLLPTMEEHAAWWTGSAESLTKFYSGHVTRPRPSQYAGGVVGAVSRFFWGRPAADLALPRRGVHVPLASDICQASADLLFSEPPTFVGDGDAAQESLEKMVNEGFLQTISGAAESAAALGGTYLRVTWDPEINPDAPFITSVDADCAVPTFRWGHLVEVTFWREVETDAQRVKRHLEHHFTRDGIGYIEHSLHEGTPTDLGQVVPLTEHPSTAPLAASLGEGGFISTESPGLAVVYVPNVLPQRAWRKHLVGKHLGRSDLHGVEGLLDNLDEVYSSWMRDIRLAKARIVVPSTMLDDNGPGRGTSFDLDREVYEGVNAPPGSITSGAGTGISAHQFAIRTAEHQATASALVAQIIRTAGYSPSTFSEEQAGEAITATEVVDRKSRTLSTRDRKILAWRPALRAILRKAMSVDAALFSGSASDGDLNVNFADGVQESLLSLAQTAQALKAAEAASTETLVRIVHPDWTDQQISNEVQAISASQPIPALTTEPQGSSEPPHQE